MCVNTFCSRVIHFLLVNMQSLKYISRNRKRRLIPKD